MHVMIDSAVSQIMGNVRFVKYYANARRLYNLARTAMTLNKCVYQCRLLGLGLLAKGEAEQGTIKNFLNSAHQKEPFSNELMKIFHSRMPANTQRKNKIACK